MTQAGLRANMGDRPSACMVLRQTTKLVKACQMASGLVWKGGKNDLRDRLKETQEVFPNISQPLTVKLSAIIYHLCIFTKHLWNQDI